MLNQLPDDILHCIFGFLDRSSFKPCEKSCKVLRKAMASASKEFKEQREAMEVAFAHGKVNEWKLLIESGSDLVDEMFMHGFGDVKEWKSFITKTFTRSYADIFGCLGFELDLRGDTCFALGHFLFHHLLNHLVRANTLLAACCKMYNLMDDDSGRSYPEVLPQMFDVQSAFFLPDLTKDGPYCDTRAHRNKIKAVAESIKQKGLTKGDDSEYWRLIKIFRRLAYVAGITKMHDEVFDLLLETMIQIMFALLSPAVIRLLGTEWCQRGKLRKIQPDQSIHTVPPLPYQKDGVTESLLVVTPVPGQLEEAAKTLSSALPNRVYSGGWHHEGDLATELTYAKSRYTRLGDKNHVNVDEPIEDALLESGSTTSSEYQLPGRRKRRKYRYEYGLSSDEDSDADVIESSDEESDTLEYDTNHSSSEDEDE